VSGTANLILAILGCLHWDRWSHFRIIDFTAAQNHLEVTAHFVQNNKYLW